jgi:hypothetical protein
LGIIDQLAVNGDQHKYERRVSFCESQPAADGEGDWDQRRSEQNRKKANPGLISRKRHQPQLQGGVEERRMGLVVDRSDKQMAPG